MGKPLQLTQPTPQLGIFPLTGNLSDSLLLKILSDQDPKNFTGLPPSPIQPIGLPHFQFRVSPKRVAIPLFQPLQNFKTTMARGGSSGGAKPQDMEGSSGASGFNNSDYLWVAAGLEVLFGTPYLARLFWAKDSNLSEGYRAATLGLISGGGFFMGAAAGNLVCRATGYLDEHLICQGVGAVVGGLLTFSVASNMVEPFQPPELNQPPSHRGNHGNGRNNDPMDGILNNTTYSMSSTSTFSTSSTVSTTSTVSTHYGTTTSYPTTSYPTSTSMGTTTSSSRPDNRYPVDSFGP